MSGCFPSIFCLPLLCSTGILVLRFWLLKQFSYHPMVKSSLVLYLILWSRGYICENIRNLRFYHLFTREYHFLFHIKIDYVTMDELEDNTTCILNISYPFKRRKSIIHCPEWRQQLCVVSCLDLPSFLPFLWTRQ